jgi:hypothetical protein
MMRGEETTVGFETTRHQIPPKLPTTLPVRHRNTKPSPQHHLISIHKPTHLGALLLSLAPGFPIFDGLALPCLTLEVGR